MSTEEKTKKLTISEFRTWLEGAEAFQGPDWTPDEKQWKIIREKISNLIEVEPVPSRSMPPFQPQRTSQLSSLQQPNEGPQVAPTPPPSQLRPAPSQMEPEIFVPRPSIPGHGATSSGLASTDEGGYESPFK